MKYTVRFCHLESLPTFSRGDIIRKGIKVGRMGNSGTSLIHLHLDIVEGYHLEVYRLYQIMNYIKDLSAVCYQYFRFLVKGLFNTDIHISSHFGTIDYGKYKNGEVVEWKFHPAYDVVPENRKITNKNYDIFWPISEYGEVLSIGHDSGYGYYINVGYEAKE